MTLGLLTLDKMDGSVDPDEAFSTNKEKTFSNQEKLPPLPVPDLGHTLDRYLDSVRPHLSPEEYRQTEFIVQQFASGIGKELHQKLLEKAKTSRNWLEKWWESAAYLEPRYPIAPHINFSGPGPYIYQAYPPQDGTQIYRAGMVLHSSMRFWKIIREERLKIDRDHKGNKLCMNQFHRGYSTCRIPGVQTDHLSFNFKTKLEGETPRHFVALCNGRIFSFDSADENYEPLTSLEISHQLQRIKDYCKSKPRGPDVSTLTALERTPWAQMRNRLISLHPENFNNLKTIETSILSVTLDEGSCADEVEIFQKSLGGTPTDKWFDKSIGIIIFENGTVGSNCDHTPVDAMVLVSSIYYNDFFVARNKGVWQGNKTIRELPQPKELVFHLDNVIQDHIVIAKSIFTKVASDLQCYTRFFTKYGRKYLRANKLHPDTHVQLALQYTYYKLHKKPAPTYETATTRRFWHGRTETMRSCTTEALEWSKTMCDKNSSIQTKYNLYLKASNKHIRLMNEAQENKGCDRHLLGLYMLAREQGIPVPQIFTDQAYSKSGGGGNFSLSTSFVGYSTVYGGVVPMTPDGYGCFYHMPNNNIVAVVTTWKSCQETDSIKFTDEFHQTLEEMREMIDTAQSTQAKL